MLVTRIACARAIVQAPSGRIGRGVVAQTVGRLGVT